MKTNWLRRALPGAIIGISITALIVLFFLISEKLNLLREAPGDNVTWGLSQVEVDVLHLRAAALGVGRDDTSLRDVRRRFNNAYSRISTFHQGRVFAPVRSDPAFAENLSVIQTRMDTLVPLIDGSDSDLEAGMPQLLLALDELGANARALALVGIKLHSQSSDNERSSFSQLLLSAAIITFALIIFMVLMSYMQVRQHRAFKKISRDAERANSRLNSSFEVSLDAIVVADNEGTILAFNKAAERVFGYSRHEAVGAEMAELIVPPALREAHVAGMARFKRTQEPRIVGQGRIEITAMRKSGEEFPVEIAIGQTTDENGTIFISYLRDITQRLDAEMNLKQARDEALQAERTKSNFLAVMSHEMRTPLNGIFGTIELLRKTGPSPDQTGYLDIAQRSGDILLHHVNDVLDITRMDAGELVLSEDVFDLHKFFEDVIETNQPTAVSRGNQLNLDISGVSENWVAADEQRLRQIAFNLISNALKFTDKGVVTLCARTDGGSDASTLEFEVIDSGVGISKEDQGKVFDRFFTQEKSYDRMASGAGLGLAICKQIVDKMGGTISLSSNLGEGSTFSVSVPVKPAEPLGQDVPPLPVSLSGNGLPNHRILLVEDNEINRMIVREMLENEGADVEEAPDGQTAIAIAGLREFTAILMDISMPGMNGVDATLHIRKHAGPNQTTPILALTAHALKEEQDRFVSAGMNACLNKPVSQAELAMAIGQAVGMEQPHTPHKQAVPKQNLVDPAIFDGLLQALKREKLDNLIHKFSAEIEGLLEDLPKHTVAPELETLGEICHRSIGSAGMIGAVSFQADLRKLEQAARAGDLQQARKEAGHVATAWPPTKQALLVELEQVVQS